MNKKFKVMLTFDVDGETLWTAPDPLNDANNASRPTVLSQARYGPLVAVPRILDLLDKYGIKSTFFIPGATVDKYPEMVAEVHKRGHEVGNHGYTHKCPDQFATVEEEIKEYEDTSKAIERVIGERPKGFRAPSWEFSVNTAQVLTETMDFTYDSSLMGSDKIGQMMVFDKTYDMPELPINWTQDDAPLWMLSGWTWGAPMPAPSTAYESWTEAFQYLYEESFENSFLLTCHPQIIGRPERIRMYERLIQFIQRHSDIEFLRCIDAAKQYIAHRDSK